MGGAVGHAHISAKETPLISDQAVSVSSDTVSSDHVIFDVNFSRGYIKGMFLHVKFYCLLL